MPDIPLLQPVVLNGVIEKFTQPETLLGRTQLMGGDRTLDSDSMQITYDIVIGNRTIAKPNVPNAEAHIIPQLGIGAVIASLIYLRDKKVFSATTMRWLRAPGSLAATNAEKGVLREITDLNNRFEKFAEFAIWQAFVTGTLVYTGGGVIINIDYQFPATHKPTAGILWTSFATADIIGDIQAWKRLISRDGQAVATDVYLNSKTIEYLQQNAAIRYLLRGSPEQTNNLLNSARFSNLLGLNWHEYDLAYVDDNGVVTSYIPDNKIVLLSNENDDRWYFYQGPSADTQAPDGHIGKFAKTWEEEDPSARQYLLEWSFLPGIWRPEQIVSATVG